MELATKLQESSILNDGLPFGTRSESPLSDVPEEPVEPVPTLKAKRQRRTRKVAISAADVILEETATIEIDQKPKKQRRKRKEAKDLIEENAEGDSDRPQKKFRRRNKVIVASEDEFEEKPKKKRRRKIPEEELVFDIPPIEKVLSTTFKGRLGYACLNTMLRKYSTPIFCSRTCRLATIAELGMEHVRSLGLQNIRDLHTLVKWNVQNGIYFMRMSSEMFPFASHPEHGYDLSFADADLKAIGETARELGVRLTSHPGQFTQLGSPREVVVRNAVRDLQYHCEMMDRMGLDQDSVMIIHMGGTFGDKVTTLERFKENYTKLLSDNIKGRLVLENDELCYNVDDLLPICKELNIPLVFDYHHDWIYPSSRPPRELIPEINQLWYDKGIKPKQHLSEPRPGAVSVMEKRAHSDRVKALPEGLPDDMDLMLECKDKEQAVFYLYRLYGLRDVDPKMLRPPAQVESLHTNGRKSNKRAKAKAAAEAAATAAAVEVDAQADAIEDGEIGDIEGEEALSKDVGGEHDTRSGAKTKTRTQLALEAEEHGLPESETKKILADTLTDGAELDCGSGDEAPEVEVPKMKAREKRRPTAKRTKRNRIFSDGKGDESGVEEKKRASIGNSRRKGKLAKIQDASNEVAVA
ncbi:hypothetical protein ACEPAH_1278 [Sanghuangporus vaninii]